MDSRPKVLQSNKNREWERERRGKLNVAFGQLAALLPDHDPSRPRSKVATLAAAIAHIRHLVQQNSTLIGGADGTMPTTERDSVYVAELARLHDRIDALRSRCQQLAQLLQMADIPVPAPAPRSSASGVQLPAQQQVTPPLKWNGNIAHKTVQRRILSSRKDKAEKKENKELLETGSTAVKNKKKKTKKKNDQKVKPNITKMVDQKEATSVEAATSISTETTVEDLSPLKKVIDLCTTPLRELTGFTLNSASVASSSSPSSSISSPSSSLSSNSPSCSTRPRTPPNDQSSLLVGESVKVAMSSTSDVAMETNEITLSTKDADVPAKGVKSSAVAIATMDVTKDVVMVTENTQSTSVGNSLKPSKESAQDSLAVSQHSTPVTSSLISVVDTASQLTGGKQNSSVVASQVLKKNAPKSKPKLATVSKSVITTSSSSKPVPVTGTVHVMKGMNPYPSIMPVTVTNTGLNFAAPAINQSIMIVLPDGRLVSVPQQQSQFVINRTTINHQSPTTIVIGNSAPVIEPIVVEAIGGTSVNGTGTRQKIVGAMQQPRVLLSKCSNKVPIPMVGTQFMVRRKMDMPVKEKRVIAKQQQQKTKKVKRTSPHVATAKEELKNVKADIKSAEKLGTQNLPSEANIKVGLLRENKNLRQGDEADPPTKTSTKSPSVDVEHETTDSIAGKLLKSKKSSVDGSGANVAPSDGVTSSGNLIPPSNPDPVTRSVPDVATLLSTDEELGSLSKNVEQKTVTELECQGNDELEKGIESQKDGVNVEKMLEVSQVCHSTEKQVEHFDDAIKNSGNNNADCIDDDDNDDNDTNFVLNAISDDDNAIENDEPVPSLKVNANGKRSADHDSSPQLPVKKLKTSEDGSCSAEMNLTCEEILDDDNFNLVNRHAEDVQMASLCDNVAFPDSSIVQDSSSSNKTNKDQNLNVEKMLESCINKDNVVSCVDVVDNLKTNSTDAGSANQDTPNSDTVLVTDVMPQLGKDSQKNVNNSSEVSTILQDIQETLESTQKTLQSSISIDSEFVAPKNPNDQTLASTFEAELLNKCDDPMIEDVSSEKILLQSCRKISDTPPMDTSNALSLIHAKLPSISRIDDSDRVDEMLNMPTTIINEQDDKCSNQNETNVTKDSCTLDVPSPISCPISTSKLPITSSNSVTDGIPVLNITPSNALQETICFPSVANETETISSIKKTVANNLKNVDCDPSETSKPLSSGLNKEGQQICEEETADENMLEQTVPQTLGTTPQTSVMSGNSDNITLETSSKQTGKITFIGEKKQKLETETQTQFDNNKTSVETIQQIGVDNVLNSCVDSSPQCDEPIRSTVTATSSKSEDVSSGLVSSNFDNGMNMVSSNFMDRNMIGGLMESKNTFWNNNSTEQHPGNGLSVYPSVNQQGMNPSKSDTFTSVSGRGCNYINSASSICAMSSSVSSNPTVSSGVGCDSLNSTTSLCTLSSNVSSTSAFATSCSSTNKPLGITQQQPIVSYKINDDIHKTKNPHISSNLGLSTKQWNLNLKTCPESMNYESGSSGTGNYFQSGYASAIKQCDNCTNYSNLVDDFNQSAVVHECNHQQKYPKFQSKTITNNSRTMQSGDMNKGTNVSNTKIVNNKVKKDIATNTANEPKVLHSSWTCFGNSHDGSSVARKQLDAINANKDRIANKDGVLNKNVRKVIKKTVSQQTDDLLNHQGLSKNSMSISSTVRKCDTRRVGAIKMKSTSSCQTIESTPISAADKFPQRNSCVTQNNVKSSTTGSFQVGESMGIQNNRKTTPQVAGNNVGHVTQPNRKSTFGGNSGAGLVSQTGEKSSNFQVGRNLVAQNNRESTFQGCSNSVVNNNNNKKPAVTSIADGSLQQQQQQNAMGFINSMPKSSSTSIVPVQHSKLVENQSDILTSQPRNDKKQDFKTLPQMSKEKNAFLDDIRLVLPHSDFSNDMFSTLQVPTGSQPHGSLSPTAAFLDAFPLVSSSKNSEMLIDSETVLQLGDTTNNCIANNIMETNTARLPNQNCLQTLTYSNNSGADLGMGASEIDKNQCHKPISLQSNQMKSGNTANLSSNSSVNHLPSHPVVDSNISKTTHTNLEKSAEQTSKIQDYQAHYNVQYDYLSPNTYQNYNYNSGYKKTVMPPKFPDTSYANVTSNNTGFASNSQPYRDLNKTATNYGQTNDDGLNYNNSIYSNWNSKPTMQLQNFDDFQTNYISSYNHFPTSSAAKNVFPTDPSFSTSSSTFGNLTTYKNLDTNVGSAGNSGVFVSQTLPTGTNSKKTGGKSVNNDVAASFIYTQASTTSNPVTTRSYSCVFSSAHDYHTSVGFPQPLYSSSNICAPDESLNPPKAVSSSGLTPVPCSGTVTSSAVLSQSVSSLTTKSATSVPTTKSNVPNKFYPGGNSSSKKQPAMFDNNPNKLNPNSAMDQSNHASKTSSYFLSPPTTLNNFNNYGNNTNTLFTGQTSSHNYQQNNAIIFSSSSSAATTITTITTTTLANSKVGNSESVKTSTSLQSRMPVNWMTMPDPRSSTLEVSSSSTYIPPDRMFTPHKDVLDFIAPIITGCGNLQPTYSGISNNSQMFYGLDMPADVDVPGKVTSSSSSSSSTANNNQMQTSSLHYSWPTSKSSLSLLSHLDNNGLGIPSTLPTLVGDLALGTNTGPSTPAADGGYRVSSNATSTIFQTVSEGEDRSNRLPSKSSSNFLDVPARSSVNYTLDMQSKPSNYLNASTKSSNFSLDASSKAPSNFLDLPAKSSNYTLDTPSKTSNFSMDVQPSSNLIQFDRNNLINDTKKTDGFKDGKSQGQRSFSTVENNSKPSSTNPTQQQHQSGGSFLSVSQLVEEVKTDKKRDNKNSTNTYKYMLNIMPPDMYCTENSSKQRDYNIGNTHNKGVTNNFGASMNVKNTSNSNNVQMPSRNNYNLLSFDTSTTNPKPNSLSFDGAATTNPKPNSLAFDGPSTTNPKPNSLSFDGNATGQKQNLLSFDANTTNQKSKHASTTQKTVANISARKPELVIGGSVTQANYGDLSSSFLTSNNASFIPANSSLPIPASVTSTSSVWPQSTSSCGNNNNNNNTCTTMKKTDGFSNSRSSSIYKGSNKYSAESLISSDRFVQDAPVADHFSAASNYGTCFDPANGHQTADMPLASSAAHFGTTSLFTTDYHHHGDYGMQNNQPMPSYQNYFGQTLDNLQPNPPSSTTTFLADGSGDFQMNSTFDSTAPYLFPAPNVPPTQSKKFNNMAPINTKPNLKTSKPVNFVASAVSSSSTGVFFPPTTMSMTPPLPPPHSSTSTTNQQPANHRYQKANSNIPPPLAPNCSSAANLSSSSSSTTNSLANFNMSTIFPEMNADKIDATSSSHRRSQLPPPAPPPAKPRLPQQGGTSDR